MILQVTNNLKSSNQRKRGREKAAKKKKKKKKISLFIWECCLLKVKISLFISSYWICLSSHFILNVCIEKNELKSVYIKLISTIERLLTPDTLLCTIDEMKLSLIDVIFIASLCHHKNMKILIIIIAWRV